MDQLDNEQGLCIRLCLDTSLMDLPWEFLYRPDYAGSHACNGGYWPVAEPFLQQGLSAFVGVRGRIFFEWQTEIAPLAL